MLDDQVQLDVTKIVGQKELEIHALRQRVEQLEQAIQQLTQPPEEATSEVVEEENY